MLSDERRGTLMNIARNGALSLAQTDDILHQGWTHQNGTCPVCGEVVSWHRGALYQSDRNVVWICLICALLELEMKRQTYPSVIGTREREKQVPIPPDFTLAWVNTIWLPRSEGEPLPTVIDVARGLGCKSAPVIWAAIMEDLQVASLKPPIKEGRDFDFWRPYLLLQGEGQKKESTRLLSYLGSEEESITTAYIHDLIRLETDDSASVDHMYFNRVTPLPYVGKNLLHQILGMGSEERCRYIPRAGIVDRSTWESMPRSDPNGLDQQAKLARIPDDQMLYLIPFTNCERFYLLDDQKLWTNDPENLYDQVGFDIGKFYDDDDSESEPLWQRVFGPCP